jgi:uncharacterized membrane protein YeaQ/YmgE (transglycosylase-associated protein family)
MNGLILLAEYNNSTINNASASITGGFGNSMQLVPPVLVVLVGALIVGVMIPLLQSLTAYEWVLSAIESVGRSVNYAIKGVITAVIIGAVFGPVYYLSTVDSETQGVLLEVIAFLVGGYLGLVALGYIGDYVWQRIGDQHEAATGHRPFESVEE